MVVFNRNALLNLLFHLFSWRYLPTRAVVSSSTGSSWEGATISFGGFTGYLPHTRVPGILHF